MSTTAAFLIVAAVIGPGLVTSYWAGRRAAGEESDRDRIIREAHERARLAALLDPVTLADTGPADPHWADRAEQLLRDVQWDGESA
jgi:hypothetical protein